MEKGSKEKKARISSHSSALTSLNSTPLSATRQTIYLAKEYKESPTKTSTSSWKLLLFKPCMKKRNNHLFDVTMCRKEGVRNMRIGGTLHPEHSHEETQQGTDRSIQGRQPCRLQKDQRKRVGPHQKTPD